MIKKLLLLALLAASALAGYAQQACDLVLTPDGSNSCILERHAIDFSLIRACRGNTVSYRVHSHSAIGYEWTVAGGSFQLNSDSTVCEVTWGGGNSGMVTVEALMPDSTICMSRLQVVLEDKPVAGVISMPNYIVNVDNPEQKLIEVCAGDTLTFVDNSTSGARPIVDYYWEFPNGVSNSRSISFVAEIPGDYPIVHRVYNECGCYDEVEIKLIVKEECPLKLSCFGTACAYSQHNYSVFSPNCTDYLWNVEGGTIVSPQHMSDVTVQWGAPESGYGMLYLDGSSCDCHCKSRKSIKVPVISDNVTISGPDTLCLGEQYTFSVPLWGATQYSWSVSPDTGITMTADNNILTLVSNRKGPFTVSVTYSCDFLGCGPYTATKVVKVQKRLDIQASPSGREVCIGSQISFTTNTPESSQWTVELNDSVVRSVFAPAFSFTFDTSGMYVVRARNDNLCNEAVTTIIVKDNPPAPTDISGPDTICPGFSAEYSANPSRPDYYILWEWNQDGDTHTYVGNKANITFGLRVEDINVYQVDRRTGCRSEATVYHVAPFRIADWPYNDLIKVCQGQTITLSNLRDQSDNDVLYEWKVMPAYPLSIQGSHLNAQVTLLANYTNDLPTTVQLILKRTYCGTYRYDVAYVRIGEIDSPTITHDPICKDVPTAFSVSNIADADRDSSYWYVDNDSDGRIYGIPARMVFDDMNSHVVHLHYVSKYGCEADASYTFTPCPPLPNMHVEANGDTLSVVVEGGGEGYSYRWMTGDTTSSIVVESTDSYRCIVTSPECGCIKEFVRGQNGDISSHGCIFVESAFRIVNHCDNIISIDHLRGHGLNYPITVRLYQGNTYRQNIVEGPNQRLLVPDTGAYSVTIYWDSGDTCYNSTVRDTITTAINIQLQNDCSGRLVVNAQRTDGLRVNISARVSKPQNGVLVGLRMGFNRVSIPIPDSGWYQVQLRLGATDCYIDTLFHFDALPTIQGVDVRRIMCKDTPFRHEADATGEGLTYKWDFGDGSWNYGNGIDHVYFYSTYPIIALTVTDRNGCTSTLSTDVTIKVNYLESYGINQAFNPLCPGDSAVIQTRFDGNNTYSWYPCSRFTSSQAFVYQAGTNIVDITSNQEKCRKQLEINVAYPNGPFAAILCDSTYCFGEIAELVGDVGEGFSYQWHILSAHSSGSSYSSNFDYHIVDTGSHQAILIVTDANGCTSSDTAYFYVHPTPAAPGLQFCTNACITDGPVELCSTTGQSLLWSNGTNGASTRYFTDGPAGAYYIDPATGCRSFPATIQIPEAPDFDGLLTGCYCIDKDDLPTRLPLYTLGSPYPLPWDWRYANSPIDIGMLPPSPDSLKIPFAGEYNLMVLDYGLGCRAVSPSLVIEDEGCKNQIDTTRRVVGFIAKKFCEQDGCVLRYRVTVRVCNDTRDPVCIDDIYPTLPISYAVTSGIPMTLNPGECQDVTMIMQYDFSAPSSFVFVMACGTKSVGAFVVDLSDWMDCVHPDTCRVDATSTFSIDAALSEPNQSAFFNFALTFPTFSGTVISVGCDHGQIIDGRYAGSTYTGLLMMDYGLMSQMVVDSADFCFHIVCCDNGTFCISTICIPYDRFWKLCGEIQNSHSYKGQRQIPNEGDKAFVLVPNPASGWVRVVEQESTDIGEEIKMIEVFSMNGQKVVTAESENQFDSSRLPSGAYIVKVVTSTDRREYLKLIKQ